jgi:hypothetical protein
MQYFDTLPKVVYRSAQGTSSLYTNLMARASIVPSVLKNPMVYYKYDLQEGDTPEIVAYKYYGDSYRYWVVLFANQIMDPQWEWPLSYAAFNSYINDKYGYNQSTGMWSVFDPYATTYQFQKIITQYDAESQITTVNTVVIDESTYVDNVNETTNSYTLPTGTVTVSVTKKILSYYEWELETNDSKRTINILNEVYVDELEKQFKNLMK